MLCDADMNDGAMIMVRNDDNDVRSVAMMGVGARYERRQCDVDDCLLLAR